MQNCYMKNKLEKIGQRKKTVNMHTCTSASIDTGDIPETKTLFCIYLMGMFLS